MAWNCQVCFEILNGEDGLYPKLTSQSLNKIVILFIFVALLLLE